MSRRRKTTQRQLSWTPDLAEVFLAPEDWTPPQSVKVWRARHHVTMIASFRTPRGFTSTAKVRLERECITGDLVQVSSEIVAADIDDFIDLVAGKAAPVAAEGLS